MLNCQTKRDIYNILAVVTVLLSIVIGYNYYFGHPETITIYAEEKKYNIVEYGIDTPQALTLEEKIVKEFGKEGREMLAIALAEHRGSINTNAVHSTQVEHSVGIFQINLAADYGNGKRVHWNKVPGNTLEEKEAWLTVPENNIEIAKQILKSQGKSAWSVYKDGKFKRYL